MTHICKPMFIELKDRGSLVWLRSEHSQMLQYHTSYEHHFLYYLIEDFARRFPFAHWLCVGITTVLLLSLLFLGFLDEKTEKKTSPLQYSFFVITAVVVLDILTQAIPMLTVYLLAQGILLYRIGSQYNYLLTTIISTLFLIIESFTQWNQYMMLGFIGEAMLFIGVAWILHQLQEANNLLNQLKQQNEQLTLQMEEDQKRLKEYQNRMKDIHRRDYLTGLYNFGGFKEEVSNHLARLEKGKSYHVVCLDIANFRQVNIEEGIEIGDQILLLLAKQLRKNLPSFVQIARYNGDQFAIGIVGDQSILHLCLNTIDQVMEEINQDRTSVQYCMGVATYPSEAGNANQLIRLAEQRLSIQQRQLRDQEEEHQRRLEKLSAVGQLAAGLAHEIRNPLTSIRGFVQISAIENKEVKKWEKIILPEIDRINDLLKQFLNLSEAKPVEYTKINLDVLMENVYSLLKPKSFLMGHDLKILKPKESIIIEADPEQIKQVMINLIQNALESIPEKGKVEVEWKKIEDHVLIRVKDNGRGIPPEHFSRIFEPFYTTKKEGTGMGLSVCHQIVEEHGGHIHVESQPGRGTIFNVRLPVSRTSEKTDDNENKEKGKKLTAATKKQ